MKTSAIIAILATILMLSSGQSTGQEVTNIGERFRLEPSKSNPGFFEVPGQSFEAEAGLETEIVFNGDSFAGFSFFAKGTKLVIENDGTLSVNREGLVVSDKSGKKWVSRTVNLSGKRTIVFLPERTAPAIKIIRGTVIDCYHQAMAEPEPGSKVAKAVTLAEMAQQTKPFILLKTPKGEQTRYVCTYKSIEEVGYVAQGDVVECIISEDGKTVTKIRKIQTAYSKETVLELQKKLTVLGYDPGPMDGLWGKKTKTVLEKFQRDNGLSLTGELDEQTKQKLGQSVDVQQLFNDYLLYVVNVYNSGTTGYAGPEVSISDNLAIEYAPATTCGYYAAPEVRDCLKENVQPIADKYGLPLMPEIENGFFFFPRNTCRGVLDKETKLLVPEFLDTWIDPIKQAGIKQRGTFPEIQFRGFRTSLSKDSGKYHVVFFTGARAILSGQQYVFKDGKWIESDDK